LTHNLEQDSDIFSFIDFKKKYKKNTKLSFFKNHIKLRQNLNIQSNFSNKAYFDVFNYFKKLQNMDNLYHKTYDKNKNAYTAYTDSTKKYKNINLDKKRRAIYSNENKRKKISLYPNK